MCVKEAQAQGYEKNCMFKSSLGKLLWWKMFNWEEEVVRKDSKMFYVKLSAALQ